MKYQGVVAKLAKAFNVKPQQVRSCIENTPVLRWSDLEFAKFQSVKIPVGECTTSIHFPIKAYEMNVVCDMSDVTIHIFTHKAQVNGEETIMVSSSDKFLECETLIDCDSDPDSLELAESLSTLPCDY